MSCKPVKNPTIDQALLTQFNKRNQAAFEQVYVKLYNELYYFTSRLYQGMETMAEDVLQDVFVSVWEKKVPFVDEVHLKGYLYLSIRNRYKNYLKHRDSKSRYHDYILNNPTEHDSHIVETEVVSLLHMSLGLLPEACAEVFRLYVEGLSGEEIAEKLGKSVNTVYAQKQQAVKILKKKLDESIFLLLMQIL